MIVYWDVNLRFLDPTWSVSAWEMLGPFNLYLGPAQYQPKEPSGIPNELMYNFRVHITSLLLSQPENCLVNIFIVSFPSRRWQPFMSKLRRILYLHFVSSSKWTLPKFVYFWVGLIILPGFNYSNCGNWHKFKFVLPNHFNKLLKARERFHKRAATYENVWNASKSHKVTIICAKHPVWSFYLINFTPEFYL